MPWTMPKRESVVATAGKGKTVALEGAATGASARAGKIGDDDIKTSAARNAANVRWRTI